MNSIRVTAAAVTIGNLGKLRAYTRRANTELGGKKHAVRYAWAPGAQEVRPPSVDRDFVGVDVICVTLSHAC